MRDIFEEIFESQPLDPEESVRRSIARSYYGQIHQQSRTAVAEDEP